MIRCFLGLNIILKKIEFGESKRFPESKRFSESKGFPEVNYSSEFFLIFKFLTDDYLH